jgi:hypothetical protein
LVDVPIRVIVPPNVTAYAMGMSSLRGSMPARVAHEMVMGMSIATMGVLFRKAEMATHGRVRRMRATRRLERLPRMPEVGVLGD